MGGKNNKNFIVVKDTSTSMDSPAIGTNMSSYHVAKSLSIYFANLLQGWFHDYYIDFSSKAILRKIKGSNCVEHWQTEKREPSANTNFLGVAELFVDIKKSGVNEANFPQGLIIVSDGEFDRTGMYKDTNIKAFKEILERAGFSKEYIKNLIFVFWDVRNTFYGSTYINRKFETYSSEAHNVFYFGGYDGSVLSFLTGQEQLIDTPKNQRELFEKAMSQEILEMVEV